MIPAGWSAEEIALRNLRTGILPPKSGTFANPFNEWIGAQMRGGICGMVLRVMPDAASLPGLTVNFACKQGILGEVFNAVLTSLAFTCEDIHTVIKTAISVPSGRQ